jgi:hypothetical protein
MSTPPQTPLDYQRTAPAPAPSNWRAAGLLLLGLILGAVAGFAVVMGIGFVFPNHIGRDADYVFFGGLAIAACSVPAFIGRRWLYAGLFAGSGVSSAFLGFLVGITSGIAC